jgi:hypothetical protein
MKTKRNTKQWLISLLVLGLICTATTVLAQQNKPRMNPLAPLQRALSAAGAAELSPEQETEIQSLMLQFRENHQRQFEATDLQSAHKAYEEAILNGDSGAAASQAALMANARIEEMVQRQIEVADFAINAIAILDPESGRADALIDQMGTRGFVRLITGLVNRPARAGFGAGLREGPRGGRGLRLGAGVP